ncbi:hypothetical protein [Bifidobacterium saguinibicoloris]|uniref:hypothetical protein n=1 Tax=Bifidobacterium saguinibicoloris TaxID=2834433 RepID=UPI001C55D3E8|nr:hypothetical protein [Bifidobacterium saguinibicoloris]MBW3081449.1 hypothetical protein [Bifidobacterium saguinibicoloris]
MTCNSQTLYVLPVHTGHGEIAMYMGDRWSFPHQASAATYVWQQLSVNQGRLRLAEYWPAWSPVSGKEEPFEGRRIDVGFRSDRAGESVTIPFHGSRVALTGRADQWGSYARVGIRRAGMGGESAMVVNPIFVSWYAKSPDSGYRYVSPELPEDDYIVSITVTGEMPGWTDKTGQRFGSVGSFVAVDHLLVM